ncbi:bifunctional indole-3-glycerol-phosphate synthase TrpC/phosphoribosylanthranilate isomerase TrpF [Aliikangiella sp. IMCC44653]
MSQNVLAQIVSNKHKEVSARKTLQNLNDFKPLLQPSERSLKAALSNEQSDFILECKKASPSKGLIREKFDLPDIIQQYKEYASAISVLADQSYFQGSLDYVKQASELVDLPILCKDFFVDEYQVYEARKYGADAILLMLSVLTDQEYLKLAKIAETLNLDILTEVHTENELQRALNLNAEIIGINNRDLRNLTTDLKVTEKLVKLIPSETIVISESGIQTHQDVKRLAPLVNGFLVGSSIMAQDDIRTHCKELLFGRVKICGLTNSQDAKYANKAGAVYGGLVFHPASPRYVTLEQAKAIVSQNQLNFVGVFVNENPANILAICSQLKLCVVQLHGGEPESFIIELRELLDNHSLNHVTIWSAQSVTKNSNFNLATSAEKILLDADCGESFGGLGKPFDWRLVPQQQQQKIIVAGGINFENCIQASELGCYAIDLSSGVEKSPGQKCHAKIEKLFQQLRA